jgi:phospholipid/cholesterol/gamma-HCH transport system ATP-binding protein
MIEIQDLHKSFGQKTVLDGVSLKIEDGKTLCVIGKSGCGKSVLLKHIVGLLIPDKGIVYVDNQNIRHKSNKELFDMRRKMGYVFQGSALFDSMNVFENITISPYEHGQRELAPLEEEAKKVLQAVGLLPDEDFNSQLFIKEWNILKDKKPSDLSGGMRKRVGVARALVGEPEYIFYDEPTTGLDPVTSEQIDDLIGALAKKYKVTSVVITHDMFSVFRIADRVAMLDKGKVRFYGDSDGLRASKDEAVVEFLERYIS